MLQILLLGFQSLLEDLDDLTLDNPEAPDHLDKFIARAVADDALPPAYVSNHHEDTPPNSNQRYFDMARRCTSDCLVGFCAAFFLLELLSLHGWTRLAM